MSIGMGEARIPTSDSDELLAVLQKPVDEQANYVDNIKAVVDNFAEVAPLLPAAGLNHVIPFWSVYGAVSGRVYERLMEDGFRVPQDVGRTMPDFYNKARSPILACLEGRAHAMPHEWQRGLYDEKVKNAHPGAQFLTDMNTHINVDLSQSLEKSGVSDEYKHDYTVIVGEILEEVAFEYAPQFMSIRSEKLNYVALKGCLRYIAFNRERAWNDGKALRSLQPDATQHAAYVKKIERRAALHGSALLRISDSALKLAA